VLSFDQDFPSEIARIVEGPNHSVKRAELALD